MKRYLPVAVLILFCRALLPAGADAQDSTTSMPPAPRFALGYRFNVGGGTGLNTSYEGTGAHVTFGLGLGVKLGVTRLHTDFLPLLATTGGTGMGLRHGVTFDLGRIGHPERKGWAMMGLEMIHSFTQFTRSESGAGGSNFYRESGRFRSAHLLMGYGFRLSHDVEFDLQVGYGIASHFGYRQSSAVAGPVVKVGYTHYLIAD